MYIPKEESRRVVANQIPVSFFRIKFDRNTADIPFGIRRTTLSSHRGKTEEKLCLGSRLKNFSFRPLGNVMSNGQAAVGSPAFCVHASFRYHFPIKMGQFFQQPDILQHDRAPRTRR